MTGMTIPKLELGVDTLAANAKTLLDTVTPSNWPETDNATRLKLIRQVRSMIARGKTLVTEANSLSSMNPGLDARITRAKERAVQALAVARRFHGLMAGSPSLKNPGPRTIRSAMATPALQPDAIPPSRRGAASPSFDSLDKMPETFRFVPKPDGEILNEAVAALDGEGDQTTQLYEDLADLDRTAPTRREGNPRAQDAHRAGIRRNIARWNRWVAGQRGTPSSYPPTQRSAEPTPPSSGSAPTNPRPAPSPSRSAPTRRLPQGPQATPASSIWDEPVPPTKRSAGNEGTMESGWDIALRRSAGVQQSSPQHASAARKRIRAAVAPAFAAALDRAVDARLLQQFAARHSGGVDAARLRAAYAESANHTFAAEFVRLVGGQPPASAEDIALGAIIAVAIAQTNARYPIVPPVAVAPMAVLVHRALRPQMAALVRMAAVIAAAPAPAAAPAAASKPAHEMAW